MRLKLFIPPILTAILFVSALSVFPQVAPAAYSASSAQWSVGLGPSSYDVDWGHGRMEGGTLWIDWQPPQIPPILDGVGVELEGRDISLGHSSSQPANFRLDTAGGGVIYNWKHFRNFRPYAKFIVSFGAIDWDNPDPHYDHETRTVTAYGGGMQFRAFRNLWARVDYEYQAWPSIAFQTLDPQGFTVGAMYDFPGFHER
jgi:opacity protein-like surface antigen